MFPISKMCYASPLVSPCRCDDRFLFRSRVTLRDLIDVDMAPTAGRCVNDLKDGFAHGKRLGLVIRSEHSDPVFTTSFIRSLFEHEGIGLFDVRTSILGHVQQGVAVLAPLGAHHGAAQVVELAATRSSGRRDRRKSRTRIPGSSRGRTNAAASAAVRRACAATTTGSWPWV